MTKENTEIPEELRIELADFIKDIQAKRGLGFNQLSKKSGVNPGILNKIYNASMKRINPYQLQKIAQALRVDYKEFYRIVKYLEDEDTENRSTEEINLNEQMDAIAIPLFDSISAGYGHLDSEAVDQIVISDIKNPQNHFAVRVCGDSMEPTIPDGSIIIIKRDEEIRSGKVGAFITSDGAVVKRLHRTERENILTSDNTMYSPIVVRKSDTYHECGRVVKVLLDI